MWDDTHECVRLANEGNAAVSCSSSCPQGGGMNLCILLLSSCIFPAYPPPAWIPQFLNHLLDVVSAEHGAVNQSLSEVFQAVDPNLVFLQVLKKHTAVIIHILSLICTQYNK